MQQHASRRNTWLFIGFLLLGGIVHYFDPTENLLLNSFLFCAQYTIYIGLILFWIQSARARLLPTRVRSYIIAAGILMVLFLTLKVINYRIVGDSVDPMFIKRYIIYAYWTPQMLVPALFLMACIRIRRGIGKKSRWDERLLLIPVVFLSLMAFTNDLHQLIYRPKVELTQFIVKSGTYSYGFGFYLLYAWMIFCWVTGLAVLLRETGRHPTKGILWIIGIALLWFTLLMLNMLVFDKYNLRLFYNLHEIHIFAMLGVFEVCIRNRLIPSNENYVGFFEQLGLPVLITDRALVPVYQTNRAITASGEELRSALKAPFHPQEDLLLSGMVIQAGYAFWTEDESELHRENRRLEAANEILSEENDLIRAENELKEKKARLDAQNQVYDRIAAALYPRQKRIAELLEASPPKTEGFRRALAECCVLNAWCKRKSNLLLLDEGTLPKRNRELFLALQESARFLKCCDVEAAAVGEETADFPLADIHDLYDSFESIIEAWLPFLRRMTVSLLEDGIRLAVDTVQELPLPESILPAEKMTSEDTVFLTIRRRKGGKAA